MQTTGKNKVSLYFHVPFCTKKCPYCHFFVVPNKEELQKIYIAALEKEWQMVYPQIQEMEVVSIYFGGGTPSLLGAKRLSNIFSWIMKSGVSVSSDCEITLEANPENVTLQLMKEFKECGVNRISLGLQSLQEPLLIVLGRGHSGNKSIEAIWDTYNAGISNISADLMFELPGQTIDDFGSTLQKIEALPLSHISLYNLTIEPHTAFYKKRSELEKKLPSSETCKKMLDLAVETLEGFGLERYEISAFARPFCQSRHNTGYWKARPFLGLGPSAFSYFDKKRFQNICNLHKYCQLIESGKSAKDFEEKLVYPDDIKELLAVELRLLEGVDLCEFQNKHAPLSSDMWHTIQKLKDKGLIEKEKDRIRLTKEGLLFYDSVAEEII